MIPSYRMYRYMNAWCIQHRHIHRTTVGLQHMIYCVPFPTHLGMAQHVKPRYFLGGPGCAISAVPGICLPPMWRKGLHRQAVQLHRCPEPGIWLKHSDPNEPTFHHGTYIVLVKFNQLGEVKDDFMVCSGILAEEPTPPAPQAWVGNGVT